MRARAGALVVAVMTMATALAAAGGSTAGTSGFEGWWKTTYGDMVVRDDGRGRLLGVYLWSDFPSSVDGFLATPERLEFTYRERTLTGRAWFELAADRQAFAGRWTEDGSHQDHGWTGTRLAVTAVTEADAAFGGSWHLADGELQVTVRGSAVQGRWGQGASLEGRLEGRRMTFQHREGEVAGRGWLELSPTGTHLMGLRTLDDGDTWQGWYASREGRRATGEPTPPKPPTPSEVRRGWLTDAVETVSFAGAWSTTYGDMELRQEGSRVTGTYPLGGGSSVDGQACGRRLTFRYREPAAQGDAWFDLSVDGRRLEGRWRQDGSGAWRAWTGERR